MGFLLKRSGWISAEANPFLRGVFVMDIRAAGWRGFFSTEESSFREFASGPAVQCFAAMLGSPKFSMTVDPYTRQLNVQSFSAQIMAKYFPTSKVIKSGQSFAGITAKLYWMLENHDFVLDQAFYLMSGTCSGFVYDEQQDTISFNMVGENLSGDRQFPPRVVTGAGFPSGLPDDSYGKPFPVVLGSAQKVPAIDISADFTRYLVMDDVTARFTGAPVTAVYENDTSKAINAQALGTDSSGNDYWYVDITGDAATSMDVTVDVAGSSGELVDALVYLLTHFSGKRDFFDLTSLRSLAVKFKAITLAAVFNDIQDGGVIQVINERLIKELPIAIVQRGDKFYFQDLLWDRDVRKVLSTDKNIISMISPPSETDRSQMANSFTVRAGVSGLRGDSLYAVARDRDNDAMCFMSAQRYGEIGTREISLPDVSDSEGATWVMNWVVETFSKMRVRTSYLCSFDALDLWLWDTVRVHDRNLGWNHAPFFKVVGIHYGEVGGIALDLLSVDDYFDVYNVNDFHPDLF